MVFFGSLRLMFHGHVDIRRLGIVLTSSVDINDGEERVLYGKISIWVVNRVSYQLSKRSVYLYHNMIIILNTLTERIQKN